MLDYQMLCYAESSAYMLHMAKVDANHASHAGVVLCICAWSDTIRRTY